MGGLCADELDLLDGSNIGVRILKLVPGRESTGEAVDNVPLVGGRGGAVGLISKGVDMGFVANSILEYDNVSSGDWLIGFVNCKEGGEGRNSGGNVESEGVEVHGEHIDDAG